MKIFSFLVSISTYVLILFVPLIIYRRWYPGRLSCVKISSSGTELIALKPNKAFFKSVSLGRPSSFTALGNGYVAYSFIPDDSSLIFSDVRLSSQVYIFSRTRLGRLRSVNLSDRCLSDIISKFSIQ